MSVSVSTIRFRAGETVRLECGETTYQVVADRKGEKLCFYRCGEQVEELLPEESGLTLEEIITHVEARHRCTLEQIKATDNQQYLVRARRELATRLRGIGYSLPRIGKVIGKHHTTVLHLLKTEARKLKATA